jgi:CheY-like chemotaxis protein
VNKAKLILVVDDEKDIAEIVSELLEGAGFRTVRAYDGQQALEILERLRPDAAVMDIKMPMIDGLEVIRRLRQNPRLRATPVVVLTATRIIRELEEDFRQMNVHSWLAKPFEPAELIASVSNALKGA